MMIWHKILFRVIVFFDLRPPLRKLLWRLRGAKFGRGTQISKLTMTWPHQVCIGNNCYLEDNLIFKFDGIWQNGPSIVVGDRTFLGCACEFNIRKSIIIGSDCLIASGCKFIDHDHGMIIGEAMNVQSCVDAGIILRNDVWLGVNVVVLKGITIGQGAIVGAGAVVTKSIDSNEIWAGIPARKIGERTTISKPFVDRV